MDNYKKKNAPVLTEFVVGKTSFLSKGVSVLRITEREDTEDGKGNLVLGDPVPKYISVPIKSIGLVEYQEQLKKITPTAPAKIVKVKKEDKDLIEMGLVVGDTAKVFDVTDEKFLEDFAEFRNNFVWRIVIFALDVEFKDQEGKVFTEFEDKKQALVNSGFTGLHLDQLFIDINSLVDERESRADFLFGLPQESMIH